jgi:hypothetical protein
VRRRLKGAGIATLYVPSTCSLVGILSLHLQATKLPSADRA